jgi:hydrogenase 3 maturation protease
VIRRGHQMSGTVVLCIGNPLGGDDAVGAHVMDLLNRALGAAGARRQAIRAPVPTGITVIDAGTAPESYTSVIRRQRPDLLMLVDAADMGLAAGAVRIVPPENIKTLSFSTHHMPLSTFISYVEPFCGKVLLVGVQPEQVETGAPISEVVRQSAEKLAKAILEGRWGDIPLLE